MAGKNIEEIAVERQGSVRQRILYPLVAMAVATAACAAVYFSGSRHQGSGHFTPTATVVPFEAVSGKSDETSSNTIVTTGNDGLLYKLKLVGDSPPEFYIDGRLLTPDEMQDHIELITNLKRQLQKRGND